jgi:hypothetical protein
VTEQVALYDHAIAAIIQPDGSFEAALIDRQISATKGGETRHDHETRLQHARYRLVPASSYRRLSVRFWRREEVCA